MDLLEEEYIWMSVNSSEEELIEFTLDEEEHLIYMYLSDNATDYIIVKKGYFLIDGEKVFELPEDEIELDDDRVYTISQIGKPIHYLDIDFLDRKRN